MVHRLQFSGLDPFDGQVRRQHRRSHRLPQGVVCGEGVQQLRGLARHRRDAALSPLVLAQQPRIAHDFRWRHRPTHQPVRARRQQAPEGKVGVGRGIDGLELHVSRCTGASRHHAQRHLLVAHAPTLVGAHPEVRPEPGQRHGRGGGDGQQRAQVVQNARDERRAGWAEAVARITGDAQVHVHAGATRGRIDDRQERGHQPLRTGEGVDRLPGDDDGVSRCQRGQVAQRNLDLAGRGLGMNLCHRDPLRVEGGGDGVDEVQVPIEGRVLREHRGVGGQRVPNGLGGSVEQHELKLHPHLHSQTGGLGAGRHPAQESPRAVVPRLVTVVRVARHGRVPRRVRQRPQRGPVRHEPHVVGGQQIGRHHHRVRHHRQRELCLRDRHSPRQAIRQVHPLAGFRGGCGRAWQLGRRGARGRRIRRCRDRLLEVCRDASAHRWQINPLGPHHIGVVHPPVAQDALAGQRLNRLHGVDGTRAPRADAPPGTTAPPAAALSGAWCGAWCTAPTGRR